MSIKQSLIDPGKLLLCSLAFILAVGSVCTFTYLVYAYIESGSVFVTSIAHIAMNNAAASLSYFVIIQNQTLANLGLTLTMLVVVAIMFAKNTLLATKIRQIQSTRRGK
jgi:hypothetical protein